MLISVISVHSTSQSLIVWLTDLWLADCLVAWFLSRQLGSQSWWSTNWRWWRLDVLFACFLSVQITREREREREGGLRERERERERAEVSEAWTEGCGLIDWLIDWFLCRPPESLAVSEGQTWGSVGWMDCLIAPFLCRLPERAEVSEAWTEGGRAATGGVADSAVTSVRASDGAGDSVAESGHQETTSCRHTVGENR